MLCVFFCAAIFTEHQIIVLPASIKNPYRKIDDWYIDRSLSFSPNLESSSYTFFAETYTKPIVWSAEQHSVINHPLQRWWLFDFFIAAKHGEILINWIKKWFIMTFNIKIGYSIWIQLLRRCQLAKALQELSIHSQWITLKLSELKCGKWKERNKKIYEKSLLKLDENNV